MTPLHIVATIDRMDRTRSAYTKFTGSVLLQSYRMSVSNRNSNDWTQRLIASNSSSSSLSSLPRSPVPERSGLMLGNVYSSEVSLRHSGPLPVNYQRVTPTRGQFPIVFSFSRGTDWPNQNENLPSNKHQTDFSRFENVSVGNKTQAASPSLGVRPLAPPVRYPAVTTPDFHTNTRQFSSSTTSGSVAPVTSTKDEFSSHGQEGVGDFHMYRPSHGDTQANGGLTSTEMVYSERREESLRSHGLFNYQRGDSFASVSLRYPSLVPLEQQVAEIDRVPKEREDRTKKQREAPQRHRDTRSRKQRESPQRHKDTRSRKQREVAQRHRDARSRKQREVAQRHTDTRSREQREVAQRHKDARSRKQREVAQRHKDARSRKLREVAQRLSGLPLSLQETPFWQCEHYQRHCTVKFSCCAMFYPCQHCHNLSGICPANHKKARHATHVKCRNCGREEEINEESQTCKRCGVKLSEYFCPKCKHFMGIDKNPFHCEKCKICRLNKDTSFHCDVCNVCMGKQMEGKHKCRLNSGQLDNCCICFEEVFTGGQIMPCSHKVHKECGSRMMFYAEIQNRVLTCPMCRHPVEGHETEDPSQDG
ncbi:uncharacterized protein [Pocillopora verrucosa]|uniref:uncharacterized protein n=1 Tax=Pocillopora verrucosa TaxID=203993 RepID=UPI0033414995